MSLTLGGINWADTHALIYFPLLGIAIGLIIYRYYAKQSLMKYLAVKKYHSLLFSHYSYVTSWIKSLLLATSLLFLFLTLLHPQWSKKEEIVTQEGRDLLIALDISRSMLAQDLKPSRLECAKSKIKKLTSLLSCERVGLILFAGAPFVQCPLTTDYGAFHMFIDTLDVQTVSSGTTAIEQAINKALQLFGSMKDKKNRILVVFTDGEDFSSNLMGIRQQAKDMGLHIFTIGVGTPEGAPVPAIDEQGKQKGVQYDNKGTIVISRLNEGILRSLSQETGAEYIKITSDDADIERLAQAVQRYEKEKFEDKKFERYEEQYPYFLIVSFICLALEWLL